MPRYALLLRGVNVGGRGKLSMTDLRSLLESLGYTDVATYLQSGNAVVTSPDIATGTVPAPERVAKQVEDGLSRHLGLHNGVLARTGPELAAVIAGNPFPDALDKPALLHVLFLSAQPDRARLAELDLTPHAPDEFRLGDRAIYLRYAVSAGRSKLSPALGRHLTRVSPGLVMTARNWNTVRKLAEMTAT